MRSPARAAPLSAVLLAGCFDSSFMIGRVCASDADCGEDLRCEERLCGGEVHPDGPQVQLARPGDVSTDGPASVEALVSWSGMTPADPDGGTPSVPAARGFLELRVDGAAMATRVIEGQVSDEARVVVPIDDVSVGVHTLQVSSHSLDGEPHPGEHARDVGRFWVHDGQPAIRVLEPDDGTSYNRKFEALDIRLSVVNVQLIAELAGDSSPLPSGRVGLFTAPTFPLCDGSPCTAEDAIATHGSGSTGGGASRDIFTVLPNDDQKTEDGVVQLTAAVLGPDEALLEHGGAPIAHTITLQFPPTEFTDG